MAPQGERERVIVILGATGTGKTKLAIEIAKALRGGEVGASTSGQGRPVVNCEVVNCDALQMYRGAPIVTNKATSEEQSGVRHHLLGFAPPTEDFNPQKFRKLWSQVLDRMRAVPGHTMPILVGGSDYYVKTLLTRQFDLSTVTPDTVSAEDADPQSPPGAPLRDLDQDQGQPPREDGEGSLGDFERLREVDSASAAWLHPNNTRRVRRYLEIFEATGVPASVLFKRQRTEQRAEGNMLYDACVFLLDARDEVLGPHLRARADAMADRGMVAELEDLYSSHEPSDRERGIFQAIGVREFREAFAGSDSNSRALSEFVEEVKKNTIRLAKKQRRRMLAWLKGAGIPYCSLDLSRVLGSSGEERNGIWREDVLERALSHLTASLSPRPTPSPSSSSPPPPPPPMEERKVYRCLLCDRTLRGRLERDQHARSRAHRKRKAKARKQGRSVPQDEFEVLTL